MTNSPSAPGSSQNQPKSSEMPYPITQQPRGLGWINLFAGASACPPGLECLLPLDQLLVHQKIELLEVMTPYETKNKYTIFNHLGDKILYAVEESHCCWRNCCGRERSFEMKIFDNSQREVISFERPLRCDTCWCPCCLQKMNVYAPPGEQVGSIEQNWSIVYPRFCIKTSTGDIVLIVVGPLFTCRLCTDVTFKVFSCDGKSEVGEIKKKWAGLIQELFTDTDNFGITFPVDLDVSMKAVMLGVCFLIDYMFFEKTKHPEYDSPGMI